MSPSHAKIQENSQSTKHTEDKTKGERALENKTQKITLKSSAV